MWPQMQCCDSLQPWTLRGIRFDLPSEPPLEAPKLEGEAPGPGAYHHVYDDILQHSLRYYRTYYRIIMLFYDPALSSR